MTMIIKKRCKYDSCLNTVTNSAQFITFHVRRRDKIRFFTYIGCECQHILKIIYVSYMKVIIHGLSVLGYFRQRLRTSLI